MQVGCKFYRNAVGRLKSGTYQLNILKEIEPMN